MAFLSYNRLWESEFDNLVSKKDKVQDLKINDLKLELYDTYEKDKKITTNFQPTDDPDVISKAHLNEKLFKINGHSSLSQKDYKELELKYNKQFVQEILIQRAVKTTIQILYHKGLLDAFPEADKVFKDFCLLQDADLI